MNAQERRSNFHIRLKDCMETAHMTPAELARRVGARRSTVSRWLAGEVDPVYANRMKIEDVFWNIGIQFPRPDLLLFRRPTSPEVPNDQVLSQMPQEVDADTQGRPGDEVPQLVQDVCPSEPAPRVPSGGGEGEIGDPRGQEGTDPADGGEDPKKALRFTCAGCKYIMTASHEWPCNKCRFHPEGRLYWAPKEAPMDMVNHTSHYTKDKIEVIDIMESIVSSMDLTPVESALTAQVVKYIARWKNKGGVEDLKKCRWYLERLIGKVES